MLTLPNDEAHTIQNNTGYAVYHKTSDVTYIAEHPTRPLLEAFPRQASKAQEELVARLEALLGLTEILLHLQGQHAPYPTLSAPLVGYAADGSVSVRLSLEEPDEGYLAPELTLREKREPDPKGDAFSLGCIAYELLSGLSNTSLRAAITKQSLIPLRQVSQSVPVVLEGLINRLLSLDREQRPLAPEVKVVLAACIQGLQSQRPEPPTIQAHELETMHREVEGFEETIAPHHEHLSKSVPIALSHPASKSAPRSSTGSAGKAVPFPTGDTPANLKERSHKPEHKQLAVVARDNYEISGELARGGLGKITIAKDSRLDRQVAIKELLRDRGIARARFLREALLTARLQHPGIVPIYEAGVWPSGEPFYTMKLIAGKPFDKVIKETKTLEERLAYLPQALDACQAMGYAHAQRIIHRDLKPHNLIVGDFGETIVIDWGLAKDLASNDEPEQEHEPYRAPIADGHDLTQAGEVMGTPAYMPVEQARGQKVDERADVYSLGGILYHLLTGQPPYTGKKSLQVIKELLDRPPVSIEEREPALPKELVAIVNKAMARLPQDRYPTAKELAEDLKKYQTGQLVGVYQYSPLDQLKRWGKKHKGALTASLVATSLLVLFGVYSVVRIAQERQLATQQRGLAIQAALGMETERDKAQAKEAQVNALYKESLLKTAQEKLESDPRATITKLQEAAQLPGETDWRRVYALALGAMSKGVAHGPAGLQAPIPVLPAKLYRAAISPDNTRVAVARGDGKLSVFTVGTTESREWEAHQGEAYSVSFSPSGKLLASAGADKKIILHDLEAGTHQTIFALTDVAKSVNFDTEDIIAASGHAGEIVIYNRSDNSTISYQAPYKVHSLNFSPDHKWLVATGDGNPITFNLENKKEQILENKITDWTGTNLIASGTVIFSADSKKIAFADAYKTGFANIFELKNKNWSLFKKIKIEENILWSLSFSADSSQLAVSSASGSVYFVEINEDRIYHLAGHKNETKDVQLSSDGKFLVSVGLDCSLRIWDLEPILGKTIFQHQAKISALILANNENLAFFGTEDGSIFKFNVDKKSSEFIGNHGSLIRSLSISENNETLISSGEGTYIKSWNLSNQTNESFEVESGDYISTISEDGKWIAFNNFADTNIYAFNVNTKEKRKLSLHEKQISKILFKNNKLYTCSSDEKIFEIDLDNKITKDLNIKTKCHHLTLTSQAELFAITGVAPFVQLKELATNKELALFKGKTLFNAVETSDHGDFVVALDKDGVLYLWSRFAPGISLTKPLVYMSDAPFAFLSQQGASFLVTTGAQVRAYVAPLPQEPTQLAGWLASLPAAPPEEE